MKTTDTQVTRLNAAFSQNACMMLFASVSETSWVWGKNQQTPVVRMKRVNGCWLNGLPGPRCCGFGLAALFLETGRHVH